MSDAHPVSPRLLLVAIVLVTTVAVGAGLSSSVTALDLHNYEWDGGSTLEAELDEAPGELVVARSAATYREADADETVAVIPVPEWSAGATNATAVREFVDRGGTVVVAGEGADENATQNSPNAILAEIGTATRIDATQLRDVNHYDRSTAVPRATLTTRLPPTEEGRARSAVTPSAVALVDGVNRVTLSRASTLALPGEDEPRPVTNLSQTVRRTGATVLVRSSPFGYLDRDGDGRFDVSERLGAYPVVAVEPVGEGRVVTVSDTSLFTNALASEDGNAAFLHALGANRETTLLDYSAAPSPPPLAGTVATVGAQTLLALLLTLVGLAALGLWLFARRRQAGDRDRSGNSVRTRAVAALDAVGTPALVASVLVAGAAVGGGVVLAGAVPVDGSPVGDGAATNGTGPHLNPAGLDDGANLTLIERRLGATAEDRAALDERALERDRLNRTLARLNGTDYRSLLRGYANVLDATAADNRSVAFEALRAEQVAFVTALEEYRTTRERYRGLVDDEAGGPDRSEVGPENETVENPRRYLAHRLEREWRTVDRAAVALIATYRAAGGNVTGNGTDNATTGPPSAQSAPRTPAAGNATLATGNATPNATGAFANSIRAVRATTERVNETQTDIRRAKLVETALTVTPRNATASVTDPVTFEGRVTAANGTGVANGTVRIVAGNRTVTARTGDDGRYSLTYRPFNLPPEPTTVVVAYAPTNASAYVRSAVAVNLAVEPGQPTVSVGVDRENADAGGTISLSGRVRAGDAGVPRVPYVVTVADEVVGHGRTDAAGRYESAVRVPDDVEAGERAVRVSIVPGLRALIPADAETTVRVG